MNILKQQFDIHDIRRTLKSKGETLTSIAIAAGKSESVCRAAFCRPSPDGERIIIEATGISANLIWPNRYNADGKRTVERKRSKRRGRCKRKTSSQLNTTVSNSAHKRAGVNHG